MSWINSATKTAAAALAIGTATTAIAGTIVIRADGPSKNAFKPGTSLKGTVRLARGDTLVVLDGGGTRTLTGPANVSVDAAGRAAPSALTALMRNTGARQVRTGAVRGAGGTSALTATSPGLWYVDTARGGTICLPDTSRAALWRASMAVPAMMTVTRVSDGKSVPVAFATGEGVKSWPVAALPIAENAEYRLSGAALAKPVTVRFAAIGTPAATPDGLATTLLGKGCNGQLEMLVAAGTPRAEAG